MTEAPAMLAAPLGAYWIGRRLVEFYRRRGVVKQNYRGINVAPALGPALILGYLAAAVAGTWMRNDSVPWLPVTTVLLGASLYGLWDDFLDESVSGFTGHFKAGLKGDLSAGLLKVITAFLVVLLFAGSLPAPLSMQFLAIIVILVSANGINLLDRRPGRALKAFFAVGMLVLWAAGPASAAAFLLTPLLAAALALAPLDFLAEGMLGDCGANFLGAALGVTAVLFLEPALQLAAAAAWGGVNMVSERISISRLIDRNRFLRYLDALGRSGEKLA